MEQTLRDRLEAGSVHGVIYPACRALGLKGQELTERIGRKIGLYTDATKAELIEAILQRPADQIEAALAGTPVPATESVSNGKDPVQALAAAVRAIAGTAAQAVDEPTVRRIVKEALAEHERPVTHRVEVVRGEQVTAGESTRPEWPRIVRAAAARRNVLLVGPAGSGKTHLAAELAKTLGLSFSSLSLTAGVSESALLGWRLPVTGGAWEYMPSPFVERYEHGGVFLFDEMDAASSNMLLIVNQALGNGGFTLPHRTGQTWCQRHPDFVAIGAANTWGTGADSQYVGRERLDESTLDRFRAATFGIDYDEHLERKLARSELVSWCHKVRALIREHRLRRVMSTRFLVDGEAILAAGGALADLQRSYFSGWPEEERRKVGEP